MKIHKLIFYFLIIIGICTAFNLTSKNVHAIETAPRISDREIIESLAVLKQGQVDFNRRIDDIRTIMLSLFGVTFALIVALFGYIAWDRRTAMHPMERRLDNFELDLQSCDLKDKDGAKVTRLINAMRLLAKTDKKVAEVLKAFSLI